MHQQQSAFENIVGKEEIARNEQFLLIPQCFLLNLIIVSPFVCIFNIISLFAAEFEEPKIGISGKGLTNFNSNTNKNVSLQKSIDADIKGLDEFIIIVLNL